MNYKNWDETVRITGQKLQTLPNGAPIRIATWGGRDPLKWFCDVELIENLRPTWFLSQLSGNWIIRNGQGARFFEKFPLRTIECLLVVYKHFPLDQEEYRIDYYQIDLFPQDPFFNSFKPSIIYYSARAKDENHKNWYTTQSKDTDELPIEVKDQWYKLEIIEFVKYLEAKSWKDEKR